MSKIPERRQRRESKKMHLFVLNSKIACDSTRNPDLYKDCRTTNAAEVTCGTCKRTRAYTYTKAAQAPSDTAKTVDLVGTLFGRPRPAEAADVTAYYDEVALADMVIPFRTDEKGRVTELLRLKSTGFWCHWKLTYLEK